MKRRTLVQLIASVLQNGYIVGFFQGKIFRGDTKQLCVPGLNCYSCPGAVAACPLGALQAIGGGRGTSFSFYVFGFLALIGVLFGRLICGFLCPFGFFQELLYRIRTKKFALPDKVHRPLTFLKYVLLLLLLVLPATITTFGIGSPYFCKYVCPSGTIFAGLPLITLNDSLQQAVGGLFTWKVSLAVGIVVFALFNYRFFCKYLCPLGAIYGLFNRVSVYNLAVVEHQCVHCGKCARVCKMQVPMPQKPNSAECIRCLDCKAACPTGAICSGYRKPAPKKTRTAQF